MHSSEPPYAHNDVKPGNVLLNHRKGKSPLAILMDFGSARPARKEIRSRTEALQLQVIHCTSFCSHATRAFVYSATIAQNRCNMCLQNYIIFSWIILIMFVGMGI